MIKDMTPKRQWGIKIKAKTPSVKKCTKRDKILIEELMKREQLLSTFEVSAIASRLMRKM